jgi:hypothetical protein
MKCEVKPGSNVVGSETGGLKKEMKSCMSAP